MLENKQPLWVAGTQPISREGSGSSHGMLIHPAPSFLPALSLPSPPSFLIPSLSSSLLFSFYSLNKYLSNTTSLLAQPLLFGAHQLAGQTDRKTHLVTGGNEEPPVLTRRGNPHEQEKSSYADWPVRIKALQ